MVETATSSSARSFVQFSPVLTSASSVRAVQPSPACSLPFVDVWGPRRKAVAQCSRSSDESSPRNKSHCAAGQTNTNTVGLAVPLRARSFHMAGRAGEGQPRFPKADVTARKRQSLSRLPAEAIQTG